MAGAARRFLAAATFLLLWSTAVPAPRNDAKVLEAALLDIRTAGNVTMEETTATRGKILFSGTTQYDYVDTKTLTQGRSDEWKALSSTQQEKLKEAGNDLARRLEERNGFTSFTPTDTRIHVYAEEQEQRDKGGYFWERPQVFRACPVGYSADGSVALVRIAFPWSGNMHSAFTNVLLERREGKWVIVARDFVYYV